MCLAVGSRDHEETDAEAFADWGIDFLKYDNCWAPASDWVIDRYTAMSRALNKTGRPIVYSMCDWGVGNPWLWAPKVMPLQGLLVCQYIPAVAAHVKASGRGWSSRPAALQARQLACAQRQWPQGSGCVESWWACRADWTYAPADRKFMAHHRGCRAQLGEHAALPGMSSISAGLWLREFTALARHALVSFCDNVLVLTPGRPLCFAGQHCGPVKVCRPGWV